MKQIPYYTCDGKPLGYRTIECVERWLAENRVTAVYGRKGHIKAIYHPKRDGDSAVDRTPHAGTQYSFRERLDNGHRNWTLKRIGKGNELRPVFLAVVAGCATGACEPCGR
ncbi:MAG TPA: hypothetical protein VN428_13440 [Bryobacteraceae bacterium]|nr:hypothetical protein [Bryobacteraceae bacterium]